LANPLLFGFHWTNKELLKEAYGKHSEKCPECRKPMKIESHPIFGDFWVCEDCGLGVEKDA